MGQVEDVLEIFKTCKQVGIEEFQGIIKHTSLLTTIGTLRRMGYKIKYVNRVYYFGGRKTVAAC